MAVACAVYLAHLAKKENPPIAYVRMFRIIARDGSESEYMDDQEHPLFVRACQLFTGVFLRHGNDVNTTYEALSNMALDASKRVLRKTNDKCIRFEMLCRVSVSNMTVPDFMISFKSKYCK